MYVGLRYTYVIAEGNVRSHLDQHQTSVTVCESIFVIVSQSHLVYLLVPRFETDYHVAKT